MTMQNTSVSPLPDSQAAPTSAMSAMSVKERAKRKLERDAREIVFALQDPDTVEIIVNADGRIWQEKLGQKIICIGNLQAAQAEAVIKTVAGYHGKEVARYNPIIEGEFPLDNSRFAGQLPPVVTSPTFAIRKKAVAIFTLDQYVENGVLSPRHCNVIKQAVREHRNILVIGGTGSGKTTLINAIIFEMVLNDPDERIFIEMRSELILIIELMRKILCCNLKPANQKHNGKQADDQGIFLCVSVFLETGIVFVHHRLLVSVEVLDRF